MVFLIGWIAFQVMPAKFGRIHACMTAKSVGKIKGIVIAATLGDLSDRAGLVEEKLFRVANAQKD